MDKKFGRRRETWGAKFVSHSHNFIYFAVPKTGSGSLLEILRQHAVITLLEEQYEYLDYPDYLNCAFVRNPWDRILSCYLNKIKKDKNFENKNFENGIMRKFKKFGVFYAGMPFNEFLNAVSTIPDDIADGHFASQHTNLVFNGTIVADFLGRFENYRAEVITFLRMVGIGAAIEFPHQNRSRNRKPYPHYYDDEAIRIVENRYREDIERFGYEF